MLSERLTGGRVRGVTFLDHLLTNDPHGVIRAHVDAMNADRAAGITWGVYHHGTLIEEFPTEYQAQWCAYDCADAADQPLTAYTVAPITTAP
jgi:hypothetical protein